MPADELRQKFLNFFAKRGHAIIPSASLVPENDASTLFITAGMQPLVPYLLGQAHPKGTRLVNVQKCVRTQDIEEVGDKTHDTFFEMLGNWSLGDYFKEDAIKWSYELLTSKEEGYGLDPARLYITVFGGNEDAPRDNESFEIWKNYVPEHRIYFLSWDGKKEPNWWSAGDNGPCGPDTEMFYDVTEEGLGDLTKEEYLKADDRQQVVEIWNNVFMEYEKKDGRVIGKLPRKNVDTGAGLERLAMVLQSKDNIFATDLFVPLMSKIDSFATKDDVREKRIVADHLRTAVFMIADGVTPANTDQGYILRRLLRRAIRYADSLGIVRAGIGDIVQTVIDTYAGVYDNLRLQEKISRKEIVQEEEKFHQTLEKGSKKITEILAQGKIISGEVAFNLYQSYGFPIEMTVELAEEQGGEVELIDFETKMREHQKISQAGVEQKFKGGLAGSSDQVLKYHTATHLLQQALADVLGPGVAQKGSNITDERLRFDFSFERKLNEEEKKAVEKIVNEKINAALPVKKITLPKEEAEATGARHLFGEKYGEMVSVYIIGEDVAQAYSKEFCGGPHVTNTKELGRFKISREEAVAAGIRRIKAVLE